MTSTDNKTLARRVLEDIFPTNDLDALREVISDQFVNHEAPPGTPPGLGGITMFMSLLNDAFSDQRWEIHDALAEGDKVVIRCTHGGMHTGDFLRPAGNRSQLRLQADAHHPRRGWQGGRALGRARRRLPDAAAHRLSAQRVKPSQDWRASGARSGRSGRA